jgi:hypothetical protein
MAGKKFDSGKEPLDLLPMEALFEIAKVLDFGKKKYDRGNWAQGIELSRLISASLRHTYKFNQGEDLDPESNINHLAHAACNLMFAIWMYKNKPQFDDRWIKETEKKKE